MPTWIRRNEILRASFPPRAKPAKGGRGREGKAPRWTDGQAEVREGKGPPSPWGPQLLLPHPSPTSAKGILTHPAAQEPLPSLRALLKQNLPTRSSLSTPLPTARALPLQFILQPEDRWDGCHPWALDWAQDPGLGS